jgi:hypothetical protein
LYTTAQQQFAQYEARLDRLAQAHIVGDEQIDARHLQGL